MNNLHVRKNHNSRELEEIWAAKSASHSRRKELLAVQCDLEAKINSLSKKKLEVSSKIKELSEKQSNLKSELAKLEKEEAALRKDVSSIDQKMDAVAKDLLSLDRKEKDKLKELEEIRQKKMQAEFDRDTLLKKRDEFSARFDEFSKRRQELSQELIKVQGEHTALNNELADLNKEEEQLHSDMSDLEEDLEVLKMDIEELNRLEKEILGSDEGVKSSGVSEVEADLKAVEAEVSCSREPVVVDSFASADVDIDKRIEEADKKMVERVEELKRGLQIIDGLINHLPMKAKKDFCSSRCFEEYRKLHGIVYEYNGSPVQKKFIRENVKWILTEIDNLLGRLPEEDIERFLNSDEFQQYSRLLEMYGVNQT